MPKTAEIQRRLADLASAGARAAASRAKIAEAAESRLEDVSGMLSDLRPRVVTDNKAAADYQALTEESGRLERVLATPPRE